jgi:hypothetical protein
MLAATITIKPNNHRVYQCQTNKKKELLNKVIEDNANADILVVCSKDSQIIKDALQNKAISVIEDKELIKNKDVACEMLISYDLPIKNIVYMARLGRASNKAIIILDEAEQKELYQIEMLLGRAIKQEVIKGFEYEKIAPKEPDFGRKPLNKEQIKEIAKKRYEEKTGEPKEKSYKEKRNFGDEERKSYDKDGNKNWDKKKKTPNKFLGKDENGKPIFSGKSGERNHHYNGTPKKTGRTINIKARKPKEE